MHSMSRGVHLFFIFSLTFLTLFGALIFYLVEYESVTKSEITAKRSFVNLVKLPDLALSNTPAFRHRSLHTIATFAPYDGALLGVSLEEFVYGYTGKNR